MYNTAFIKKSFLLIALFSLLLIGSSFAEKGLEASIAITDGVWTYTIDETDGTIHRTNIHTNITVRVAEVKASKLIVYEDWIYYIKNENPYGRAGDFYRIRTNGSDNQQLFTNEGYAPPSNLILYKNRLFFNYRARTHSMALDGSDLKEEYFGGTSFIIDDDTLYFQYEFLIRTFDLNSKEITEYRPDRSISDIVICDDWIYVATKYGKKESFYRLSKDFAIKEIIDSPYYSFYSLVAYNGRMYAAAESIESNQPTIVTWTSDNLDIEVIRNASVYSIACINDGLIVNSYAYLTQLDLEDGTASLVTERPVSDTAYKILSDNSIVFTTNDGIYKQTQSGEELLLTENVGDSMFLDNQTLVYRGYRSKKGIVVLNPSTKEERLINDSTDYHIIGLEDNYIYVCDQVAINSDKQGYLYKLPVDATDMSEKIQLHPFYLYGKIYQGHLYKQKFRPENPYDALARVNLETTEEKELFKRSASSYSFDGDSVYYTVGNYNNHSIYRNSIWGGQEKVLYTAKSDFKPNELFIDDQRIYFKETHSTSRNTTFKSIKKDGSDSITHFILSGEPIGIIDNTLLYRPSNRYFKITLSEPEKALTLLSNFIHASIIE